MYYKCNQLEIHSSIEMAYLPLAERTNVPVTYLDITIEYLHHLCFKSTCTVLYELFLTTERK
jgi:hypothetical protein